MIVESDTFTGESVRNITFPGSITAIIDGIAREVSNLVVTSQTVAGFMALTDLEPWLRHMRCWHEDGSDCPTCPVKKAHEGCVISAIKAACKEQANR
jgi:hypothetical protein